MDWAFHTGRLKGELLDLGLGGAAFTLPVCPEPGETLLLQFKNRRLGTVMECRCEVVRTAAVEVGDGWTVQVRFPSRLTLDQIQPFALKLVPVETAGRV
jgi:hypothetical protein